MPSLRCERRRGNFGIDYSYERKKSEQGWQLKDVAGFHWIDPKGEKFFNKTWGLGRKRFGIFKTATNITPSWKSVSNLGSKAHLPPPLEVHGWKSLRGVKAFWAKFLGGTPFWVLKVQKYVKFKNYLLTFKVSFNLTIQTKKQHNFVKYSWRRLMGSRIMG